MTTLSKSIFTFTFFLLLTNNLLAQIDDIYKTYVPDGGDSTKMVKVKPRFPGCEDLELSGKELDQCAQKELYKYVFQNLQYPRLARENSTQGNVVVSFIVERDGTISNTTITRNIGHGCGEEFLRVVNKMKAEITWLPGIVNGAPVRVQYHLPCRFKLEGKVKKRKRSKKRSKQ